MEKIKLVIFDMDGTILDTLRDLQNSLNYALRFLGYKERTIDEVKSFVGNGIRKLIERALTSGTGNEDKDIAYAAFKEHYGTHCYDFTKPYEGIIPLLGELRSNGIKTACVSNKDDSAVQTLSEIFFKGMFDVSIGNREGFLRKPSPDNVNEVLRILAEKRENAVYVGDSEVDIETARNADMKCISVSWGFREREQLMKAGALVIADKPLDVLKITGIV